MTRQYQVNSLLQTLLTSGSVSGLNDAELVARVADRSSAASDLAFASLVDRHGPMVLRVCRGALQNPHDAHDAFQATFLVLLRQAASLRRPEAVSSWLHGVAVRAARCLVRQKRRRMRYEREASQRIGFSFEPNRDDRELGRALHEEIEALPARERRVVVLCELQGRSYREAASNLGCPIGTVKSRLFEAKRRLRAGLTRRGFAPATTLMLAALAEEATACAVPWSLHAATLEAARSFVMNPALPSVEVVSTSVSALTVGVMRSMAIGKFKLMSIIATALVLTGSMVAGQFGGGGQQPQRTDGGDRLQSLETKLDRLIQVLEASAQSQAPKANAVAGSADTRPGDPFRGNLYTTNVPATGTYTTNVPTSGTVVAANAPRPGADSIEERLEQLDARVRRLESVILPVEKPKQDAQEPSRKANGVDFNYQKPSAEASTEADVIKKQ